MNKKAIAEEALALRISEAVKANGGGAAVSRKSGILEATISRWVRGLSSPSAAGLARLCKVCGVSVGYMFGEPDGAENITEQSAAETAARYTGLSIAECQIIRSMDLDSEERRGLSALLTDFRKHAEDWESVFGFVQRYITAAETARGHIIDEPQDDTVTRCRKETERENVTDELRRWAIGHIEKSLREAAENEHS